MKPSFQYFDTRPTPEPDEPVGRVMTETRLGDSSNAGVLGTRKRSVSQIEPNATVVVMRSSPDGLSRASETNASAMAILPETSCVVL